MLTCVTGLQAKSWKPVMNYSSPEIAGRASGPPEAIAQIQSNKQGKESQVTFGFSPL